MAVSAASISIHRVKSVAVVQKVGGNGSRWTELKIVSESVYGADKSVDVETELTLFHLDNGALQLSFGPSE